MTEATPAMLDSERKEARSESVRPYKVVGETYGGETWKQYRLVSCGCSYVTDAYVRKDEPLWCALHRNEG